MRNSNKALLIDLDGTLYHGKHRIDGADLWIQELKSLHIPYLFVTNNSSRTPEDVAAHLVEMGIPATQEDVYTSALAAAQYVKEHYPQGVRAAVIGEYGLETALRDIGVQITEDQPEIVVQGIDRSFDYVKLTQAVQWIREGAAYILTNPDLLLPSDTGIMPGAGTLSAAIQAATQREPIVMGKPSNIIMNYALARLDCEPQNAIVVGDNPLTDLRAGQAAGCDTILVLTGLATEANKDQLLAQAGVQPSMVCKDLYEAAAVTSGRKSQ
ncbi:TIGR01457 family HAD-type hydrolase [Paenibacillus terrigena]|uniref:TIGR01457 family HAD-type hydrolase n=1 Tax=Paenibacillus terrigena TaxID=369333 RepID=UPI0028D59566|nr:TIGR01457 family HAD-type hydrolase [Paenibacillus terrigena]